MRLQLGIIVRDEGQQRKASFDTSSGYARRASHSSEDLPPDQLYASDTSRFDGLHEVGQKSAFTCRGFFFAVILIFGNSARSALSK